jgi:hypothetical protein
MPARHREHHGAGSELPDSRWCMSRLFSDRGRRGRRPVRPRGEYSNVVLWR